MESRFLLLSNSLIKTKVTMKRLSSSESKEKNVKKAKKYMSESKLKDVSSLFLSDKKHSNSLLDLIEQLRKPSETPTACVSAVHQLFVELLQRRDMTVDDSKSIGDAEKQYKEWLCGCYKEALNKICLCLQRGTAECRLQALNSLFDLLSHEARNPLQIKKNDIKPNSFPVAVLKEILQSLSESSKLNQEVTKRFEEYAQYKDVASYIWIAFYRLLKEYSKKQPPDRVMWNALSLLSKVPKLKKGTDVVLCNIENGVASEKAISGAAANIWKQLAKWQFSTLTHQLMLVVLVERIMPLLENVIFLTDFFMDTLNSNQCEISMLGLQGIFNLVIKHNIEYPDIYGKLYQLFSKETFKARYKTRLFALTDDFLRSTHLPLALVAAFAKKFSRLLLIASPPDQLILMTFIANLLIRHRDLVILFHNPNGKEMDDDPFDENERDPVKSGAMDSQLWEVKLLQHHHLERVAKMATFINRDLPSVEFQLEPLLDLSWDKLVKKEFKQLRYKIPKVAEKFEDKPLSNKMLEGRQIEIKTLLSEFNSWFDCSKENKLVLSAS